LSLAPYSQVLAIGHANGIDHQCFGTCDDASLSELTRTLDEALRGFAHGAFVRLGSRSPKDTPIGLATGCRATTGLEAIRLLTAGSRRIAFDLRQCLRYRYRPWLFLRAWQEIDGYAELRCFWLGGRLAGVSQYHHRCPLPQPTRGWLIAGAGHAIARFLPRFRAAWGAHASVFDLWLSPVAPDGRATLIEINPCGASTDPCLFSWQDGDFDGSLRIRTESGIERHALFADTSV